MQQRKRTRASHPKVRTGCHTCKARRVKCDEQQPNCQKCLNTGRKCEGYKNNREWVIVVAPPAPMTDGFEDDRSRRHFDYFRSLAVYDLSWFFEGEFLGSLVLSESHSSAAVRHAAIALSVSHEDFKNNLTVAAMAPQYACAAQHYSKAIRNLIKETKDSAQESRMRTLTCGLLFISIEVLRGNNIAALHHLEGCLKIVREAQSKMNGYGTPSNTHLSEPETRLSEEIIPMFARLDVQASLPLDRRPTDNRMHPIVWEPSQHIHIDDPPLSNFKTVLEACNSLLLMSNRIHQFMRFNSDQYRYQLVRPIPVSVIANKMMLYDQLMQWENAIQPLLNSSENQFSRDQLQLMRIHNRTGVILLESSLHVEECILDNYRWAFEDMVNYTAELQAQPYHSDDGYSTTSDSSGTLERSSLTDSSSRSNGQAMNSHPMKTDLPRPRSRTFFFLDNGVIFSLYWTALKSRDGLLRRRAIALLESSAQEGTWIGPIQAAITKRVVEIEEMQPYEQDPPPEMIKKPEDIPEFIRVHSVGTDIDKTRRRAKMVILQRLNGLDGEWDERVEWVHW